MRDNPPQTVLIVDDDADIRMALRMVLEDAGYHVVEASDGVVALALLRTLTAPVVMLTNHNMPRMDGPTLIDFITSDPALAQRHRVIYMTANERVLSPHLAQTLVAHGILHLCKPFDLDAVVDAVQAAETGLRDAAADDAH